MQLLPTFLVSIGLSAIPVALCAQVDLDLGTITERHEMIPMRDNQRLSAYLYFPSGSGPWPAVFEQRYADLRAAGTRRAAAKLAEAGYVVVLVNFRGTHLSEGTWVGYRALGWGELKDGYDTCEWLAKQSWCTGNVGTFGSSQGGYAQNFLAVTQPPHLKCQYMVDTGLSLFQEGYRIGGITRPNRFLAMASNCRNPDDNRKLLEEWFRHPNYDDYWQEEDCSLHFDKMNVPCFTIGSWYDFMSQGSLNSFYGRQGKGGPNSRGKQQIVVGPWLHGRLNKTNRVGELVYPENAIWPEHEHMVRWFDHYLKDKDNGIDRDPAMRFYVMGAVGEPGAPGNFWHEGGTLSRSATGLVYFLQPDGGLDGLMPNASGGSTSYLSDPRHPMEIPGASFPGARDARLFELQPQVRTFTTEPLDEPVEWTGDVWAQLWVSSTATDTDFIVRISDVYPDGRSILIMDYPQRARYRQNIGEQKLLEPGKVTKVPFRVGALSQIFNKGHRIRVTVASTGAPLYEPNPQTGGPQTIDFPEDAQTAINTIHHNRSNASNITVTGKRGPAETERLRHAMDPTRVGAEAGVSSAAVVTGDVPLVYTVQCVRQLEKTHIAAAQDAARQFDQVLFELRVALGNGGSGFSHVVKLNVYLAKQELQELIQAKIASTFKDHLPAVSYVVTPLSYPGALVAADAVGIKTADTGIAGAYVWYNAGILPEGTRLYVSGQAQPGMDIREATRKTMENLVATLKHCGRTDDDIVQLKCFFHPMSLVNDVNAEINQYFGSRRVPPISFVEWKSTSPPIEIELVAWGGPANNDAKEAIEFITPPGMTASPVFSRVARVNRGGTIFIGDIAAPPAGIPEEQLQSSFDVLGKLLAKTASDFRHLAKATYYVTDDEISKAHNAIRPKFYDPTRPPAASKALVESTGHTGSRYVMDMIAVPAK